MAAVAWLQISTYNLRIAAAFDAILYKYMGKYITEWML